ncbi:MAG: hypothetical protein HY725_10365 [Candidatus Rokubacteria bacterium]|nr:hypothetical protein [Candidatus Rokubacteria bacterium]
MFDRAFFEQHFHEQTRAFAREHTVASPVVEFLLDDGSLLYVRSLIQTKENWLCLLAYDDEATRQIYCPYYSIKRITLHAHPPKTAPRRELGFQLR